MRLERCFVYFFNEDFKEINRLFESEEMFLLGDLTLTSATVSLGERGMYSMPVVETYFKNLPLLSSCNNLCISEIRK